MELRHPKFPRVIFVIFYFFIFYFLTVPMNSVHQQCKSTTVQTVAQNSATFHKTALPCHVRRTRVPCALSHALCRARSISTPPNQPSHVATPNDQPCHDKENSVATDFSPPLMCRCHDTKVMSRLKSPSFPNPVATLKTLIATLKTLVETQGGPTLS